MIRESLLKEGPSEFYHGSPHMFDKFSFDKIGSGDGLNKYGYGLYFTDSIDTAKWYAKELSIGDLRDTGFNIYAVKLRQLDSFYQWEEETNLSVMDTIVNKLIKMGFYEEAAQINEEYEEYGKAWELRNMYEYLAHVLGGRKETSEFLFNCGVAGVIANSAMHSSDIYVAYSDEIIKIIDVEKA